jgi:hypothetical protein
MTSIAKARFFLDCVDGAGKKRASVILQSPGGGANQNQHVEDSGGTHKRAQHASLFMGHHCAGRCIPQRHAGFREPPISEDLREQRDEWDAVRVSEIERVGRAKLQVYGAGKGWHQLGRESLRLRVVLSSD